MTSILRIAILLMFQLSNPGRIGDVNFGLSKKDFYFLSGYASDVDHIVYSFNALGYIYWEGWRATILLYPEQARHLFPVALFLPQK